MHYKYCFITEWKSTISLHYSYCTQYKMSYEIQTDSAEVFWHTSRVQYSTGKQFFIKKLLKLLKTIHQNKQQ